MKKTVLFVLSCLAMLNAQAQTGKALVLEFITGETMELMLSDTPRVVFDEDSYEVFVNDEHLASIYSVMLLRFYFSDATGIDAPQAAEKSKMRFDYRDRSRLIITGDCKASDIRLYNTSGQLLNADISGHDGEYTLTLDALQPGTYIVRAGNASIKLKR